MLVKIACLVVIFCFLYGQCYGVVCPNFPPDSQIVCGHNSGNACAGCPNGCKSMQFDLRSRKNCRGSYCCSSGSINCGKRAEDTTEDAENAQPILCGDQHIGYSISLVMEADFKEVLR